MARDSDRNPSSLLEEGLLLVDPEHMSEEDLRQIKEEVDLDVVLFREWLTSLLATCYGEEEADVVLSVLIFKMADWDPLLQYFDDLREDIIEC